jgi:hypothetical protein
MQANMKPISDSKGRDQQSKADDFIRGRLHTALSLARISGSALREPESLAGSCGSRASRVKRRSRLTPINGSGKVGRWSWVKRSNYVWWYGVSIAQSQCTHTHGSIGWRRRTRVPVRFHDWSAASSPTGLVLKLPAWPEPNFRLHPDGTRSGHLSAQRTTNPFPCCDQHAVRPLGPEVQNSSILGGPDAQSR